MLWRGRLTVAALGLAVAGAGAELLGGGADPGPGDPAGAPAAAAAQEPPAAAAPRNDLAPDELLSRIPITAARLEELLAGGPASASDVRHLVELVPPPAGRADLAAPLRVDYTLDRELMREVFAILARGRVELGHAIVLEPGSGRVLAYASTDPVRFPPDRIYPAASLVKVITAAAALDGSPEVARQECRYVGNPYRLTRSRVDPPRSGNSVSLRKALATSNNQCFAQLAVHRIGSDGLLGAIDRFGWLSPPAPVHPPGEALPSQDPLELGKLGSGLAGSRITPLHAAQLAATLARGQRVEPYWIAAVSDGSGRRLSVPHGPATDVLTPELAKELRAMLVDTTERGTARRAFRTRRGPLLGPVRVAGKTGSLSGRDPDGRYEWFVGVAPADEPKIAVAVVVVQKPRWWVTPSQVAAETLKKIFCSPAPCRPEAAERWLAEPTPGLLARSPAPQ
jgi:cell division protein FtsI/penicillin-binding protein 2